MLNTANIIAEDKILATQVLELIPLREQLNLERKVHISLRPPIMRTPKQ